MSGIACCRAKRGLWLVDWGPPRRRRGPLVPLPLPLLQKQSIPLRRADQRNRPPSARDADKDRTTAPPSDRLTQTRSRTATRSRDATRSQVAATVSSALSRALKRNRKLDD